MLPSPGVGFASDLSPPQAKPGIDAVLTTPVREGAVDDWSRFHGASAAIGHYIRLVHEGRLDPFAGWEAICGYNAAMLRPSWPLDRLQAESERLWALHVKRNGPPLLRAARVDAPASPLPTFSLGALLDDTSPMPEDVIGPRVLTPGGLATKGFVKFLRDPSGFGFPITRSRFGYLCVEGMQFGAPVEHVDPTTGEVTTEVRQVLPSHFKCPQSGLCLQVENPAVWVYPEGLADDLTHMSEA